MIYSTVYSTQPYLHLRNQNRSLVDRVMKHLYQLAVWSSSFISFISPSSLSIPGYNTSVGFWHQSSVLSGGPFLYCMNLWCWTQPGKIRNGIFNVCVLDSELPALVLSPLGFPYPLEPSKVRPGAHSYSLIFPLLDITWWLLFLDFYLLLWLQ